MTTPVDVAGAELAPYADHADLVDAGAELHDHHTTDAPAVRGFLAGASSTSARHAAWPDYEWATWLPAVLRAAGLTVVVEPGFAGNGRPRSVGTFTPRGVMIHDDASPKGPTPAEAEFIAHTGRPAEGIPAPLAQCWVCLGCDGAHPVGTWHALAAGRANHAGTGGPWGGVGKDAGNAALIGVETDHTAGEHEAPELYASLVTGAAAILAHLRSDPARWLVGHKEYAPGRKIDPADVDMHQLRRDVHRKISRPAADPRGSSSPDRPQDFPSTCSPACPAGCRHHHPAGPRPRPGAHHGAPRPTWSPAPFPGRHHFRTGHSSPFVARLEHWLHRAGYLTGPRSDLFTPATRAAVRRFQLDHAELAGDADGFPGPLTWKLAQIAAHTTKPARPAP